MILLPSKYKALHEGPVRQSGPGLSAFSCACRRVLSGLALSPLVLAEQGGTVSGAAQAALQSSPHGLQYSDYLQLIGGLLFVILLIYGCAFLVKRLNGSVLPAAGRMKIVGGLSVGQKERIVLVEVDNTRIVVGVSPNQLSALHVFAAGAGEQAPRLGPEDGGLAEGGGMSADAGTELGQSFAQRLKQALLQGGQT